MPFISFESGTLAPGVKAKLLEELTNVAAEVTGIPKSMFMVSVRELPDDAVCVGGVTVAELKRRKTE